MNHYTSNKRNKELVQITTKLNKKNHNRLSELGKWFNEQEVNLNQMELLNDLLDYAFTSIENTLKIDDQSIRLAEVINSIDRDFELKKIAKVTDHEDNEEEEKKKKFLKQYKKLS